MISKPLSILFDETELMGLAQPELRREALGRRLQRREMGLVFSGTDGRLKHSSELALFGADCSRLYDQH